MDHLKTVWEKNPLRQSTEVLDPFCQARLPRWSVRAWIHGRGDGTLWLFNNLLWKMSYHIIIDDKHSTYHVIMFYVFVFNMVIFYRYAK